VGKFAIFGRNCCLSWKWYEIDPWLLWITNRKSQVADRSVSVPMTFSDLEKAGHEWSIFILIQNDQIWHGYTGGGEACL